MSQRIDYDSVILNEEFEPVEYLVDHAVVEGYCNDWANPDPLFLTASSIGVSGAHPPGGGRRAAQGRLPGPRRTVPAGTGTRRVRAAAATRRLP